MIVPALRSLFGLAAAGALLWFLWTRFRTTDRHTRRVIAAGFLLRAVGGQLLFWISYLHLPIAPSLQHGNGLWFYGIDSLLYAPRARFLAAGGLLHLGSAPVTWISRFYIQVDAVLVYFLGTATSIGLLLNLLSYLAAAWILVRWVRGGLPLLALSFAPTSILWAMQPLKESFFAFVFLLFLFVVARAIASHRWRDALLVVVVAYPLGSIRWYVAMAAVATMAIALAVETVRTRDRSRFALLALALIGGATTAVFAGSWGQLPLEVRQLVAPPARASDVAARPRDVVHIVGLARQAFDGQGGHTMIKPGPQLRRTPEVHRSRIAAGIAAMVVPHAVAESVGLLRIEGGRGLWWFADVQTAVFDVIGVLALLAFVRAVRARRAGEPMLSQLIVFVIAVGLAQAYAESNFGTLLRHRDMVMLALALIPAIVAPPARSAAEEPLPDGTRLRSAA